MAVLATDRRVSVWEGSMSCPKCSHETKVLGTEKNKRIFYCERCELVIKEKKLEDKLEMS